MTLYAYIAQSLDGYIAGPNGEIDWLHDVENPESSDFGFTKFFEQIDALVMGRKTFEKVATFDEWPYNKPVYVISSTVTSLPSKYYGKVILLNLKPSEIVEKLESDGLTNLYIDGGSLIQSFLSEDLIDKLIITTIPILLGDGIALFGKLESCIILNYESTEVFVNQLVQTTYSVKRE